MMRGISPQPELQGTALSSRPINGDGASCVGVLKGYFEQLSTGGNVTMPLEKAPWGDTFGMLTDRFGVPWLVNITGQKA